jgi:hypothetical protein
MIKAQGCQRSYTGTHEAAKIQRMRARSSASAYFNIDMYI